MKIYLLFIGVMLALVAPAFAEGTLNVTRGGLNAPSYINTNQTVVVLNITLNATFGNVNVTGINISLMGTASTGNISAVSVYNDSDNNGVIGSSDILLGANNTWDTVSNISWVNFTTDFMVPAEKVVFFLIVFNTSTNAASVATVGANISSNLSIFVRGNNNITIPTTTINSTLSQIQDVHATGTLTSRFVDTSVVNQSFLAVLNVQGRDNFENISITVPPEYPIMNVTALSNTTAIIYNISLAGLNLNISFGGNTINISNFTRGFNSEDSIIRINFTANTSAAAVPSLSVNLTISGGNLSYVNVTANSTGSLNVTTQVMISVINASVTKRTAIVNGTDYWEFNLTVNITANASGLLQFRMNNWSSTTRGSGILSLTNETGIFGSGTLTYYATLRNQSSTSGSSQVNVTTDYGSLTRGLSLSYTALTRILVLKMIIPNGTPTADDWRTTYFMLFRSDT